MKIAGQFAAQPGIYFYTYDTDENEHETFEYFASNRIVFFEPKEVYHKEFILDVRTELSFDRFAGYLMQNLGYAPLTSSLSSAMLGLQAPPDTDL